MRKLFTTLAAVATLSFAGCLGPDNAYNSLKNWNAEVTESDAVAEIIYIAMNIIPVYGIVLLGDIVIFNTIDYWTGDNPIGEAGPFPNEAFTSK